MKTVLIITLLLLSQKSMATGYHCKAECIEINSRRLTIRYLGSVEASGSKTYFSEQTLFEQLQGICSSRSLEAEAGTRLVMGIRASHYVYDEVFSVYRQVNHQSSEHGIFGTSAKGIKLMHAFSWNDRFDESHAAWISGSHARYDHIEYWPTSDRGACAIDSRIPDDEIPEYRGRATDHR